jgi:Protein of unknown function (DUF2795)
MVSDRNHELEKKEQIPNEFNEEQTLRIIRKQDQIPGEGRSKTINDMPSAAALAQLLKDFEFPAYKSKIVQFIQQKKVSDPNSNQILPLLDRIEERQYQNVADINLSAKLVQRSKGEEPRAIKMAQALQKEERENSSK